MNRKSLVLFGGIVSLAIVAVAAYWFATAPTRTLKEIHAAAKDRDVATLDRLIDFRSFKGSIRLLVSDVAGEAAGGQGKPLALISKIVIDRMAAPVVEAAVTPEAIAAMFSGALPVKSHRMAEQGGSEPARVQMTTSWTNSSAVRVRVQVTDEPTKGVSFVMRRDGLTWRLSGVER